MSVVMAGEKHPHPQKLALYAHGDLPAWRRITIARHVDQCPLCERFVVRIREAVTDLREQAANQTLTGFEAIADWPHLEAEMAANISVGLAAARCVHSNKSARKWVLGSLATSGLAALLVISWVLHIPSEESRMLAGKLYRLVGGAGAVLQTPTMRSSPEGIAVRAQGLTLTMRHPKSAVVSVAGSSVLEARFVDEETGQVTISSVYAQ